MKKIKTKSYKNLKHLSGEAYKLLKPMTFSEMVKAVGGEKEIRKHLYTREEIQAYQDAQKNGEVGPLLTSGYSNFFFALMEDDSLAIVGVYWSSDDREWNMWSDPPSYSGQWPAGYRLFLRASRPENPHLASLTPRLILEIGEERYEVDLKKIPISK